MSLRALLRGVRDTIRTTYTLDETGCQVTPDGKPDPVCGEWFYAVHPGGTSNAARNYLDERADFYVTLTRRAGFSPEDRIGEEVLLDNAGILARADQLKALLHMEYPVMDAANALIPGFGVTVNGFVEPPGFLRLDYLGPKGPDWFWAEGYDPAPSGIAVQLAFGGARRIQDTRSDT